MVLLVGFYIYTYIEGESELVLLMFYLDILFFVDILFLEEKTILKLTSLAGVISKVEACLTASLNTLDMALWDFSQEKEPPAIEEKVSYAL